MEILAILTWLKNHKRIAANAICAVCAGLFMLWSVNTYKDNKKLSEQLEMVQNNVEAYQGALNGSQQAYNVIKLDMDKLAEQNDVLIHRLDSVRKELNIKTKQLTTAATQTQTINVNQSQGVKGDLTVILKDSIYKDSILYNPQTKVYYTISRDTVSVGLALENTQYLYLYNQREYKNKKSFIKRLFTWDFKKVTKYKYEIENTNDLLNTTDVRVVEKTSK